MENKIVTRTYDFADNFRIRTIYRVYRYQPFIPTLMLLPTLMCCYQP